MLLDVVVARLAPGPGVGAEKAGRDLVEIAANLGKLLLADRLSNVQRLDTHPRPEKQRHYYDETVRSIVPLAERHPWFRDWYGAWRSEHGHELGQILEAAKSHFGVGGGGRILEIENMYASPKSNNPAYRVIPLVVRADVGGLPYTFELQLTTRRASIAADLKHNTVFKPYVEMSPAEKNTVRRMLAEAAALDQEETRWNH